jgi:hypothetical protein
VHLQAANADRCTTDQGKKKVEKSIFGFPGGQFSGPCTASALRRGVALINVSQFFFQQTTGTGAILP